MAYMRYYRSKLSENEKNAYDQFVLGIAKRRDRIELPYVSGDELERVYYAINYDYPDFFYLNFVQYVYTTTPNCVYVDMPYLMSFDEAVRVKAQIDKKARKIADAVMGMSDTDKEAYIHDALRKMAVYDINTSHPLNAHNLIGPFLEGKCVCEGFAKAFKYLADMVNLKSIIVLGTGGAMGENKEPHSWNMVRIDGNNYHLDVTYDEIYNGYISRAYFNLSDLEILRDHTLDGVFELPRCTKNQNTVPVISSTADLMRFLKYESERNVRCSEMRLTKRFSIEEIENMISRKATYTDYEWINKISSYTKGSYAFLVWWRV